jgi:aminomethyltransferase
MPIPSPFHERTQELCESYRWKDWAGYYAVCSFGHSHEKEYFAFRESAGLIDVSPLYKYDITGPEAADLLARMMTRDITRLKVGQVTYCCWCDDDGKIVDDGTVCRISEQHYRLTAADPSYHWLRKLAGPFDAEIEDTSARFGALALQGPTSRDILKACSDINMDSMRFFRTASGTIGGVPASVTRTGYTGDLGYEIWCESTDALAVWDALMDAGFSYGIQPAGLDALDLSRIEAGFIMLGVDYFSAPKVVVDSRKSTPYELGLGWTVNLDREPFMGQQALKAEKKNGSIWQLVGLELSWEELEALYDSYGLPPNLPAHASRDALPVYRGDRQVGQATSHAWSPILKKSLALASVRTGNGDLGSHLSMEHTVEYERRKVGARVVEMPFYNPKRKRKP